MLAAVVSGLGFEVIYGDTDSVMYSIDFQTSDTSLVHCYVNQIHESYVNVSEIDISEFVAGSKDAFICTDRHVLPICNIVVKVLNTIMSYTCLTGLSVEQQRTEFTMSTGQNSAIFPSFMVVSNKHYVGMLRDQSLYTKGMSYIRRSGSTLSSIASEEFVKTVLSTPDINLIRIKLSRLCAEYKWKVGSGRYPHLLDINIKYMGKRANYIRVVPVLGGPYRYIESSDVTELFNIDKDYYYKNIRTSLETVTKALGVDIDPIYSGEVTRY